MIKEKIKQIKYSRLNSYEKYIIYIINNMKEHKFSNIPNSIYYNYGGRILFEKQIINKIILVDSDLISNVVTLSKRNDGLPLPLIKNTICKHLKWNDYNFYQNIK